MLRPAVMRTIVSSVLRKTSLLGFFAESFQDAHSLALPQGVSG